MTGPIQIGSGPLSPEQAAALNHVLATMSPTQAAWLGGYLTAVASGAGGSVGAVAGALPVAAALGGAGGEKLTILVGSQTGNAEGVAEEALGKAKAKGLNAAIVAMDKIKPAKLKNEANLMVIVSTHGEGEPPDNAEDLYEYINSKKADKLEATRFTVLGLGDTSYEQYCQMGKDFDAQLEKLGGNRVSPRVDCDVDYEDDASAWVDAALAAFDDVMEKGGAANGVTAGAMGFAPGAVGAPASQFGKKNPFQAPLLVNVNLSGRGSAKETRHLEVSLEGSGLVYEPGDALGVYATNNQEMVEAILAETGVSANEVVDGISVADQLATKLDITTLTRPVIEKYAALDPKSRCKALLDDKNKKTLSAYIDGREIIDLLEDFPVEEISAEQLASIMRKMPPRLYSIASSLKACPDEVHLTVAVTKYETHGRERFGVASTWLAALAEDDTMPVYIDTNKNFKLPDDPNAPIIMIGPGTGIAPFRSFVQEREAIGAGGKNWLFFGDQHFATDFLYQVEWQSWLKDGLLSHMDVAFSRDQEQKVYVQHRILEQAKRFYEWIQNGAAIYVCGDSEHMAPDVHAAILKVLQDQGGLSAEAAEAELKTMQKDKRYNRDVY